VTLCAIHQPNFFPWLGYFDKIKRADVFVFMDDVDYPRSGSGGMGSWSNRVKLDIQGNAQWFGCPVDKKTGKGLIKDVRISRDANWREKALRTLEMNYKKSAYFDAAIAVIKPLLMNPTESLSDFNTHAIQVLATSLGVQTKFFWQSQLNTKTSSTDLLIEICKAVGAEAYLAGGGAAGYQEDEKFEAAGLKLVFQNYLPAPYGRDDVFIPGLSIIDYLMREGVSEL